MTHFLTILIATIALFSGMAWAEEIEVPGGWKITFDSPPLQNAQEGMRGEDYAYRGSNDRFNLSLFVEKPPASAAPTASHKECQEHYWLLTRQNPTITPGSSKVTHGPRFSTVQYQSVAFLKDKPVRSTHRHFYFVHAGKWVDVHLSVVDATPADEEMLTRFARTLEYTAPAG